MRVAVVGGGINGAGIAWELARRDYDVTLFEKGRCGAQTSAKTTKLIHGGIRYLEGMHVALVREALRDRAWLLAHLPQLVHPIEFILPVYGDSPRWRMTIRTGLRLYDALSGRANIAPHRELTVEEITARAPITSERLRGGFSFWDAQTDDYAMARVVVASAAKEGAAIREGTRVTALVRDGERWIVRTDSEEDHFDVVVNAAGPWMNELLAANGIRSRYHLSLVRGSHIVLTRRVCEPALLLQSISDRRVFFVTPWKETTLVGTTEVMQRDSLDQVRPSDGEIEYLLARFNHYFREPIGHHHIAASFAGVRPLVGRSANPSAIGREYRIERRGNLINVFGGKMTTFLSLSRKVAMRVDNYAGRPRRAREPLFAI